MTCENEAESNAMVDKMETCLIGVNQGIKNIWYKYSMDDVTKGEINCPINEVDSSRIGFCTALTSALKLSNGLKADEKLMNWYLEDPDRIVKLESDLFSFKNTSYQFNNLNKIQFFDRSTVEYDEVIPVDVVGSFTVNGQEVKKGLPLILPAYQIALFSDYTNEAVNNKAFWLTVNVGSVFMGIGEYRLFLEAGKLIQKSFTAIDIVGNGIGIYAQIANEDAISAELRSKINIASLLSTVPNLLISFTKLSNVVDEIDEVLNQKLYKEENYEGIITKEVEVAKTALKSSQERISENFADEILEIADEGCNFGCKVSKYGCFAGETPIATKAGQKPIKEIHTADTVLTYNHKQKQTAWKVVTAIQKYVATTILAIVMMQGDTLWATPEHPFWSNGAYIASKDLRPGDLLFDIQDNYSAIKQVIERDTTLTVYNFTVSDNSNYYVGRTGYLVHNTCFLKKIEESPGLVQAIDNLPIVLKGQFIQDFYEAGEDVIKVLKEKPGCVRAWEDIFVAAKRANPGIPDAGKILRKDIKSLEALSKFDNSLISKIGQEKFDNFLEKLIKANPECKTCGNKGDMLVGNLDDVLDDFHKVITQRAVKPDGSFVVGFDDFLIEAGEQASKAKGAALTLKELSNNWDEISEGGAYSIKKFEGNIPDIETNHRLDVQMSKFEGGQEIEKSSEMKNWSGPRSIIGTTFDQFKAHIISGKKFDYYFSDGLQQAMKSRFESLFKDSSKATELFNSNPTFFRNLSNEINNAEDLVDLANNGDLINLINWVK
ncbi:MAG: HINT domain-containing protein [Saprospiraceae bacterium]|nr:HINT domain-containing protein [Saprospiraceae bacterium]